MLTSLFAINGVVMKPNSSQLDASLSVPEEKQRLDIYQSIGTIRSIFVSDQRDQHKTM